MSQLRNEEPWRGVLVGKLQMQYYGDSSNANNDTSWLGCTRTSIGHEKKGVGYVQICTDAFALQGGSHLEFQRTLRRVRRGYTMFVRNILRRPSFCHNKTASSGPYKLWNEVLAGSRWQNNLNSHNQH